MSRSHFHIKLAVVCSLVVVTFHAIEITNAQELKPFAQFLNISSRLSTGSGENNLIAGFIISGVDSKKVIVRTLGPSLASFGVSNALSDPTLELHDGTGATIAVNDNWKDTQQSQIAAANFAPRDDRESAIVATLAPGAYTAIARGAGGTTGVVLMEIYDLDQKANSRLANVSARGYVDLGDNVLIGGAIVGGGNGGVNVIVTRALGPSLESAGVQNAMQDPVLELHNQEGTLLDSNDNWKEGNHQALTDNGLAPSDDREPAIFAVLPPGAYTAIVHGKNDNTGVALVEFYTLR
ncbi:MAG: hypothetical protein QOE73_354 [Verrucomicrobiota bacterium]